MKIKRALSLILCAVLILGVLSACGNKPAEKPEETSLSDSVERPDSFEDAVFGISTALALGMRFFDDPSYLDSASVLWNTIGWFSCWREANGEDGGLTTTQVYALQHALRASGEYVPIPDNWVGSSVTTEDKGGEIVWSFPGFTQNYKEMTEALKPSLTALDGNKVKVVLTNEEGENEEYVFTFEKDEAVGGEFPYVLKEMSLPEVQGATESEANFDYEMLREANTLENLLNIYGSVKEEYYFNGEKNYEKYFFRKNGEIACVAKFTQGGTGSLDGVYGSRDFTLMGGMPGEPGAYLCSYEYLDLDSGSESFSYFFNYTISEMIVYGAVTDLEEKDGTYTFYMGRSEEEYYEENLVPIYTVDKGTLAIKEIVADMDDDSSRTVFTYGEEPVDYGVLDGWDRPLRKVTVVAELHDDNFNTVNLTRTYEVPDNMELLPYYYKPLNMYFNPGYTETYEYSNDLGDYTIYVTDAMG